MATFREFVHICAVYVLLNQVTNHHAFSFFNFGQAQVKRKAPPPESNSHLNAAPNHQEHVNNLPSNSHQKAPSNVPVLHQNNAPLLHQQPHLDEFQINHHDKDPNALHQNNRNPIVNHPRPVNNLPVLHRQDNIEANLDHRNPHGFYHQANLREQHRRPDEQFNFHHDDEFVDEDRVFQAKRAHQDFADEVRRGPRARRPHQDFVDEVRDPRARRPHQDFVNEVRGPRAKRPHSNFVNEAQDPRAKRPHRGPINEARAHQAKRPRQDINQPIFDLYEYIANPDMHQYDNNPSIRRNQPPPFQRAPNQALRHNMRPRNDPIYQKIHPNNAENDIRRPFAAHQRSRIRGMPNQNPIYDQVGGIRQNQQSWNGVRQPMNSARQNIRHVHILQDEPYQRPRARNAHMIYDGIRPRANFNPQIRQFGDRIRQPVNPARSNMYYDHIPEKSYVHKFQDNYEEVQMQRRNQERADYWSNWKADRAQNQPMNQFAPRQEFQPIHQEAFDDNLKPRREFDYIQPLNDPRGEFHNQADGIRTQKATFAGQRRTIEVERQTLGGPRQTLKHFRYSRIRRYYTLSTASMTTWKKLNYTTRLMYTTPTTPTPRIYTAPHWGGSSRQTVLHTRMTESDEVGKDLFASGSIEYKDDSFDKPPTAMVAYDSLQMDSARNASTLGTAVVAPVTTPTKPTPKTTKKASIELISLESSSEEKPSSSEAKEEESSPESEEFGNEKLYGEYGYYRKFNHTPTPIVIDTYPNIREVPGFEEFNLTSAEVAFWEANASWIMDKYFPSSELTVVSNYSEENLVRSFFLPENIEARHLDFYKWYYKLLTNPERVRTIYNRTVLDEPDYKNLSQFTPFVIPEELQRYYMFINQMENEMNREKKQEEYQIRNEREAEQNIDKILGVATGAAGRGGRPLAGEAARKSKKDDPDVSQILQMIDRHEQSDSLMREDDTSDGFIDVSRFKRDVSKFEPD